MFAARLLGCKGEGNAGVGSGGGVVAVSAYMGGTRGSGILASAGDVLEMSVVRGVGGTKRIQPARGWCATVGETVRGNTVQIVSTCSASPEVRPPSFLGKPAVRPRSMAGGAPTHCGRHWVVSRESGAPADQVEETPGRASLEKLGCRTPPQLNAGGVGRQQQQRCR